MHTCVCLYLTILSQFAVRIRIKSHIVILVIRTLVRIFLIRIRIRETAFDKEIFVLILQLGEV